MIGYKGIILTNGVLRSKYGDIFEINVPREYQEVDDGMAFSECGYSFCGTIEEVSYYESFIAPMQTRKFRDVRLFEIDTLDGTVIGSSSHYKSSKIKVVREITQNEIIGYFKNNTAAMEKMLKGPDWTGEKCDTYGLYCSEKIEDYKYIDDIDEMEDLYIRSCERLEQKGLCQQKDLLQKLKISGCNGCFGYYILGGPKTYKEDYLYLLARRKIKNGMNLEQIEEYDNLKARRKKNEIKALELLNKWRFKR